MHIFDQLIAAIEGGANQEAVNLIRSDPELVRKRYRDEEPIHIAIRSCNREFTQELLKAGAHVNARGNRGETPLHYAIRASQFDIVTLLLSYSPDVEQENDQGFTPLLLAARQGERAIADELLSHGAKMDFHSAVALGRAEIVSQMLKRNPDIYKSVLYKNDLLPDAVYADSPDTVAVLLECPWIDVHAYGLSGEPPLAVAVSASHLNPKMAELLIAHGADPYRKYGHGYTAFDKARSVGTLAFLGLPRE